MIEINCFTESRIKKACWTKERLAKAMGINRYTFDYAVPQYWLNSFVNEYRLDYDLVQSTTYFLYHTEAYGVPVSGCAEVVEHLSKFTRHYPILYRHQMPL